MDEIQIIKWLALLLIGYSLFSAITLAIGHFRDDLYKDHVISKSMGILVLIALISLQISHFNWLYLNTSWIDTLPYRISLFTVAPAFYWFSQPLLHPENVQSFRAIHLFHGIPLIISLILPNSVVLPFAFVIGAVYLVWLARSLFLLRNERDNFRFEIILLCTVFVIAIAVSLLGFFQEWLPEKLFYNLYAISIGLALFLIQVILGLRPQLPNEVRETAQTTYANTSLANINCETTITKLEALMNNKRVFMDPEIKLSHLAEQLNISSHQLSELINVHIGMGFSRYLRKHRIDAAKIMLCAEHSASVLSVGLSVGFSSQSNFYEAFREIEGMTPGRYRKLYCNTIHSS